MGDLPAGSINSDAVALLISRISDLVSHYDGVHRAVNEDLGALDDRISTLERFVYMMSGGITLAAFVITIYVTYLTIKWS